MKHLDRDGDRVDAEPAVTARLHAALAQCAHLQRTVELLRRENGLLRALALEDPLTGLANRRALMEVWAHEAAQSRRHGYPCSVLAADLDRFKQVNDRYGHAVGDRVLATVAHLLTTTVRAEDVVARVGGEEFTIVLPHADLLDALAVAERVRRAVAAADLAPYPGPCTLSAGLACSRRTPHHALLRAADRALYAAKARGRDRVVVWEGDVQVP